MRGSVVLVHKAAEAVATLDIAAGRYELWRLGRLERESAVGTLAVVVLDVDAQDVFEVAAADDQEPVERFRSDGADEPLCVGVRLRRSHRRVDHPDPFAAEPSSKQAVNLLSRSWIRKRIRSKRPVKL